MLITDAIKWEIAKNKVKLDFYLGSWKIVNKSLMFGVAFGNVLRMKTF